MSDATNIVLPAVLMGAGVTLVSTALLRGAGAQVHRERQGRTEARAAFVERDSVLKLTYPLLVALEPVGGPLIRATFARDVEHNLRRIGMHEEEIDVSLFGAICLASGLAFTLLGSMAGFAIGLPLVGLLALVPGWYIPVAMLESRAREHQVSVSRRFPFFLELCALAMRAGATFRDSCQLFVDENPQLPLSRELRKLVDLMNQGKTEEDALRAFSERAENPEISVSVNTIVQGQELGTPLAALIANQSIVMRKGRVRKAEKLAEEAAVRMSGPTTIIMVACLILIVGPMILTAAGSGLF